MSCVGETNETEVPLSDKGSEKNESAVTQDL